MDLLTPDLGLLVWQIIIFGILFFVLSRFAWKPITSSLKEREDDIQSALDMAKQTKAEMAQLKAQNDKILVEARIERDTILRGAKETSDRMIAEAQTKAAAEGQRMLEQARDAMQNERQAMVSQMKREMVSLSLGIAEKVLNKELSDKTAQEQLVNDLVAQSRLN